MTEQLSIFNLPAQDTTEPLPMPEDVPITVQRLDEPITGKSFNFPCDIPLHPDCGSILAKGVRVVILEKKYGHAARVPGIVKGFISNEVLVQRRDGEGLYRRNELHRVDR